MKKPSVKIYKEMQDGGFYEAWADLSDSTFASYLWAYGKSREKTGIELSQKMHDLGLELLAQANKLNKQISEKETYL